MDSSKYTKYRPILRRDLDSLPQVRRLDGDTQLAMKAVSAVFPFRTNAYVVNELIDWDDIPDDPIFQLTFPQRGMLEDEDFAGMADLVRKDTPARQLFAPAHAIRKRMNPHPAGQMQHNVPRYRGIPLPGIQHKYRDTVLFFPSQGQTCHAYCTYCFRWAQFVGDQEMKFSARETELFHAYLKEHSEVSDVLFTGGDPLIMKTRHLRDYIEPLLGEDFEHIRHIRLGSKALSYWPFRFTQGEDADDLLRLIEEIREAGRLPAVMAHFSHPVELSTPEVVKAIRRLQGAGAVIRTQAPLVRHVNDSSTIWAEMWTDQTAQGLVPYYMFVERDTGPKAYFEVPLARALRIFRRAYRRISGLSRTMRGPSMSAMPGKVQLLDTLEIRGEKYFQLMMLRGRNPEWAGKSFLARYDDEATWLSHLEPAFGKPAFFWEREMKVMPRRESVQTELRMGPTPRAS
ncbi:MAG: lysine 2,3-aminomutase [bacterium]